MQDLAAKIAAVREDLTPTWDAAHSDRLLQGVCRLRRRRRSHHALAGLSALALAVFSALATLVGVFDSGRRPTRTDRDVARDTSASLQPLAATASALPARVPVAATRVDAGQGLRLADGSFAHVSSATGFLTVLQNQPAHIELALQTGSAHFNVVPNTQRSFTVTAGAVRVAVVGTVFDVERRQARVRVAVREGKVHVRTPHGSEYVRGGESAWFDEVELPAAPVSRAHGPTAHAVASHHHNMPQVSWRSLYEGGDYDAAAELLLRGDTQVANDPSTLMDAAEAVRFSNHPEASVLYLRRVLREHPHSPVAALAGFTLGRVLLERLGEPAEAAEAFAFVRSAQPRGSLAQDALAREVEALSKAGDSHNAFLRARLYIQLYPSGRRLRAVRLFGGLE